MRAGRGGRGGPDSAGRLRRVRVAGLGGVGPRSLSHESRSRSGPETSYCEVVTSHESAAALRLVQWNGRPARRRPGPGSTRRQAAAELRVDGQTARLRLAGGAGHHHHFRLRFDPFDVSRQRSVLRVTGRARQPAGGCPQRALVVAGAIRLAERWPGLTRTDSDDSGPISDITN
jgi:hypothetical protein